MNRNTNAHFSELPSVDVSRSTFDRSFSHKFSGNVGDVIPIFYDEILPGDTVSMDTSKVIRFQTLLTPMMDNIYCDVYWFFVPNRLVWDHWQELMGENSKSAWLPDVQYSVPTMIVPKPATGNATPNNNKVGTILDYLGFPVGLESQLSNIEINALPIRGYCKIMNDWFRSENLTDPINLYTGDATVTAYTADSYIDDVAQGGMPFKAAKFADYFTRALPDAQKGEPIGIPLSLEGSAPVYAKSDIVPYGESIEHNKNLIFGWDFPTTSYGNIAHSNGYRADDVWASSDSVVYDNTIASTPLNLWSEFNFDNVLQSSITVNDLRYAFQMQKLLERDARGGSRYIEVLKSHFGVTSPDARLQRSEYLGGNRFGITVNQVSNQAQSEQDFLGDLGAYSVTTDVHSDFTKSFVEHGMLFGLAVLRHDHTYAQGLERFWKRRDRFSYYWPVLANIGEQPIDKSELFATAEGTFGYQEAWAEYRYKPNRVSGEMRPYVPNGLFSWTLTDDYESAPSLSDSWLREGVSSVDRVLAVTSKVSHQFWADFYFNFKHTRPMPVYSVPGLIDHH